MRVVPETLCGADGEETSQLQTGSSKIPALDINTVGKGAAAVASVQQMYRCPLLSFHISLKDSYLSHPCARFKYPCFTSRCD